MTFAPALRLYELAAADPALRFSPHCWKIRMALAHKGLRAEGIPWRFTDKEAIAATGQGLVPVLEDDGQVIHESWAIAVHLEARHPDHPSLFGGPAGEALTRFVNSWADAALVGPIARVIALDIHARVHDRDKAYFRQTREKRFGMTLEEVVAEPEQKLAALRAALLPLRLMLKAQPFIAGDAPAYADYCVFGMFMWARCISPIELLEPDDAVHAWRERLLDAFGGLARAAPCVAP
ncbi:glutathione S-transferase family protein [Xanthobacter autotrophicus DSM 431]|uniref:glutathione S-transferase family protein n=1 Tax=Xanthobacter nonsaccharivorans TaxID=3119912 RepID=UPI00372A1C7F